MRKSWLNCNCCDHCLYKHGPGPFFGRLFISLLFILAGIGKFVDYSVAVDTLRQAGISGASAYIIVGGIIEIIGGLMILFGYYTRIGCWILMIFLFPTTIIFHGFWRLEGMQAQLQLVEFLKNLAIFGGLLLLASYGPGHWSFDALRKKNGGSCCSNNRNH